MDFPRKYAQNASFPWQTETRSGQKRANLRPHWIFNADDADTGQVTNYAVLVVPVWL